MKGLRFPSSNTVSSTASDDSSAEELPAGWKKVTSRSTGKSYYLQISTGATQWEKPVEEGKAKNVADKITSGASRLGAGLTSMFNTANTKLQNSLNTNRTATSGPRQINDVDREGQEVSEIFENERIDGSLNSQDPKKYSDMALGDGSDLFPEVELPPEYEWASEWEVDTAYTSVDKEGWTYGVDFDDINRLFQNDCSHASKHPTDVVRRRRWIRYRKKMSDSSDNSHPDIIVTDSARNDSGIKDTEELDLPAATTTSNETVDDPFSKAQKANQGSGFRVPNMKFPRRGDKDHTKEYQNLGVTDIAWLVKVEPKDLTKSAEALRAETANLTERIKDASQRTSEVDKNLHRKRDKSSKRIQEFDSKLGSMVQQYKQLQESHGRLMSSVSELRSNVDKLKQETTKLDNAQNEEQRVLNDGMETANQAMEEKAKALATARLRYKQDIKTLSEKFQEASTRREQISVDASENPLRGELKLCFDKLSDAQSKLEAVRHHRHALDEERRELFNQVVEHRADIKMSSKNKLEQSLNTVEKQISKLKEEQRSLIKSYTQNSDPTTRIKIDGRRNEIRAQLSSLRERRMNLNTQRKDQ